MNEAIGNAIGFLEDQIAKEQEAFKGFKHLSNIEELQSTVTQLKSFQTSCHGCKYDNSDVDEEERKAHCIPCLEPVTLRRNYAESST